MSDVLIVYRQHNDKEWKFKEQHAKIWENSVGAKRYFRPRGFNIAGASAPFAPAVPTSLHLGLLSHFAELTDVTNRQADREIDAACVTRRLLLRHSLQKH